MSYILDALRRADSERGRGAVPGVHVQQVPAGAADADAAPASRLWVGLSLALAAVLAGVLGWAWLGRDRPADATEAARAVTAPTAVPTPTPAAVAAEPSPPPASPAAPAPPPAPVATVLAAVPAPVAGASAARPPSVTLAAAATRSKPVAPAKPAPAVLANARVAAPAASAAAAPVHLPTANELPEDIQRGLPTLLIGGASYSQNAESRMLIVNGQVFREGDKLAPEVSLEQIRLKEAVLSTKGYRYRIAY